MILQVFRDLLYIVSLKGLRGCSLRVKFLCLGFLGFFACFICLIVFYASLSVMCLPLAFVIVCCGVGTHLFLLGFAFSWGSCKRCMEVDVVE